MATYGLSPQGSSYQKALLQSYEAFPINDRAALDRLYFQCATEGAFEGMDKASTAARVKWVEDNLEAIKEIGSDFRANPGFWDEADSPWMFLAACHEIAEFHKVGYGYESRLFCYQDATCSGLQVFSALGRDEIGGFSVNLVPGHDRQDIYGLVAERAVANLKAVDVSSLDEELLAIHHAVVEHGLNRKACKRQVMTRPYNAKQRSCTDYTHEWYKKEIAEGKFTLPRKAGAPEGDDSDPANVHSSFEVAAYASKAIWDAIGEAIPAANRMMMYIEDCVKMTVKANPGAPIQWKLADGMVCVINKREQGEKPIQTRINSLMHKRTMKVDTAVQSTRQHGNAAPPNFIHSLDALHLRETARMWEDKCAAQGRKPVYTFVHDSFGVPAADMAEFSKTIREAFVRIHSELDLMGSFIDALQELAGPDVVFPERPAMGGLDINGVLNSEFFFS
jgi:DNA-directed RNA polymerase